MAAATALALSGCAFGHDDDALDDVAFETRSAGTARVTRTLALPRYGIRRTIGVVDFVGGRAKLSTPAYRIDELIDGRTLYARYPGASEWIKVSGDNLRNRLMSGDPLAWIAGLRDAEGVEKLGGSGYRARVSGIDGELWTDDSRRAARIRYVDASDARLTIEYAEFGVDTSIDLPDAGSTITAAEHQGRVRHEAEALLRLSEPE
jgi:hypothetical protein